MSASALLLSLSLFVPPQEPPPAAAPGFPEESWWFRRNAEEPWALFDVRIVDPVRDAVAEPANLVIQGDRILAVTTELPPLEMEVVDGEGAYVLAGLFDLHAHVIEPSARMPGPTPAEALGALLRAGVTTVRLLPAISEDAQELRAEVNAGRLAGPTIVPASGIFEQRPERTPFGFVDPGTARAWVEKEALLGSRWIKVYNAMDEPSLRAIVEAAHAHGMEVCGHAQGVLPREAVTIGQRTLEHIVDFPLSCLADGAARPPPGLMGTGPAWRDYDPLKGEALMRFLIERGAAWVPTLVVTERILEGGAHDRVSLDEGELAELDRALTRAAREVVRLHRMGGLVGLGTDFPVDGVVPGESALRELELLVERGGATPAEALTIGTLSSARILGLEPLLGTVEAGKLAHLVLLRENPLADVRHLASRFLVVHDGRPHALE